MHPDLPRFCSHCGSALSELKTVVVETAQGAAEVARVICKSCGKWIAVIPLALAGSMLVGDTAIPPKPPGIIGAGPAEARGDAPAEIARFDVSIQVTTTATAGTTGNPVLDRIFAEGGDPNSVSLRRGKREEA